jgi:hypothetical protein
MATVQAKTAVQHDLRALADYGATLAELLEYLEDQNGTLGRGGFSDDQDEELQLYCWALNNCKSTGFGAGLPSALEDDIGA